MCVEKWGEGGRVDGGRGFYCVNWWVSFAPDFQCWYFCESSLLFYLNFDFCVSKIMHFHANQTTQQCLRNQSKQMARLVDRKPVEAPPPPPPPLPPSNFIIGRPKAALLFWYIGGFRYGVWLCFVILVRYKNRKLVQTDV